ncbi:MAG TPA: PadR family transcriptional regulator [Verrucomicrobiae bacterium]|nr:PadR family transcriptional regulator [Verrucomicrobiae bacterium]
MFTEHFSDMHHFRHFMHGRHGFGRGRRGMGGFGRGRGRGEMKYEILSAIESAPRHGYDIMLEIEARTGARPSPGSIYPALQMLEDGDFIRGEERDGKRVYSITDAGRKLLAERPNNEPSGDDRDFHSVIAAAMEQIHGIKDAAKHLARSGDVEVFRKAVKVLERTRRDLYAILSEEPGEAEED